jgi:polyhydroxyalkanoate synthesis regulator phasin
MKEDLKEILLMGLGALNLTGEKARELKQELLEKGNELYEQGKVKNEELKHKIKESITVIENKELDLDELKEQLSKLDEKDKNDIINYLNEKEKKVEIK